MPPRSLSIALAGAVLLVAGAFPTVMYGDDGELVRATWGIGTAHPPGFPAYLLLAKPLTLLPLGSIALRVHLASVLAAAATAVLISLLATRWGAGRYGAWFGALAFCAAPIVHQQSRLARTYPFLAAATVATVLLADRLLDRQGGTRRDLHLLLFTTSLSLGFHQLMLVPLAAVLVVAAARRHPGIGSSVALLPVGLLPFLALPLRSAAATHPSGWGAIATLADLAGHLGQHEYAGKMTSAGGSLRSLAATAAGSIPYELTVPLLLLAVAGMVLLSRRRPSAATLLLVIAGGTILLRIAYVGAGETGPDAYRVIVRYFLGMFALAAALAGVGWGLLLRIAGERDPRGSGPLATLLTVLAVAAILSRPVAIARAETDWLWHDKARGTLLSSPAAGLLLVGGDDLLFPIWYLQGPGGYAPDRMAVSVEGFGRPWYRRETGDNARRIVGPAAAALGQAPDAPSLVETARASGIPVAAAMIPPAANAEQAPVLRSPAGRWAAAGLAYRLLAEGEGPPAADGGSWRVIPMRHPQLAAPQESRVPLSQVSWFLTVAARQERSGGRPAAALPLLFRASALDPEDAVVHNETGLVLMELGMSGPAAEAFREALRLRPGDETFLRNLRTAQSPPAAGPSNREVTR